MGSRIKHFAAFDCLLLRVTPNNLVDCDCVYRPPTERLTQLAQGDYSASLTDALLPCAHPRPVEFLSTLHLIPRVILLSQYCRLVLTQVQGADHSQITCAQGGYQKVESTLSQYNECTSSSSLIYLFIHANPYPDG
jgi:hypothetical protein